MSSYKTPPSTTIDSNSVKEYESVKNNTVSVLCGTNNSGKSFVLKKMVKELGDTATYLGPQRYYNFQLLNQAPRENKKAEKRNQLNRSISDTEKNVDNTPLNLAQAIAELNNEQRSKLITLMKKLLGSSMEIENIHRNNDMSPKYIKVDDYNLSFSSSGYRLIATLITSLLDTDYTHIFIDEPELGVSPEVQSNFAEFLFDASNRKTYFPHIQALTIATHSPIFLNRINISSNYYITRDNNSIRIKRLSSIHELNDLQFNLLGNRFETLFLPTVIILVEGKCDFSYIQKALAIRFPDSTLSIVQCNSDNQIKNKFHTIKQSFHDFTKSPYSKRVFAVFDSVHSKGLADSLVAMDMPIENIITWDDNGIEFNYPKRLLKLIFGEYSKLDIKDDRIISDTGISKTKSELCEYIVLNMGLDEDLPDEINTKLLSKINAVIY